MVTCTAGTAENVIVRSRVQGPMNGPAKLFSAFLKTVSTGVM
jgi:hypothetical protein